MPNSNEAIPRGPSSIVYLGLGSSLGDRRANLNAAIVRLERCGIRITKVSPVYESPHLGLRPGDETRFPPHLNLVVEGETSMSPDTLLGALHRVEAEGGRERKERWGPRTIDIDLLTYGSVVLETERLTLPHPGIAIRAFVARPLIDIAPLFRLPNGALLRDRLDLEPIVSQSITRLLDGPPVDTGRILLQSEPVSRP